MQSTIDRRFQYAIEKSVLILSDLNLVTGTAILIAGYSQLRCGISAYHWQMMVFISWFASFAFVSATAFLEGCSQTNKNRGGDMSRTCLRTLPGTKFKRFLSFLESKTLPPTIQAYIWHLPYLSLYAGFITVRASYDVLESMLLEILWLAFAMAWGTIKVWDTRAAASWNYDGYNFTLNQKISEENSWGFGQTLPLILLLLPLLSMAQAYLDDDAKAQEALRADEDTLSPSATAAAEEVVDPSAIDPDTSESRDCDRPVNLPRYPYDSFSSHSWYHDHLILLVSQVIMVGAVALFFLTRLADILGISSILRSRLFVIWILAILPLASFIHLATWYLAALIVDWES
ncbi:hypothetical protein J4E89_008157 [Alternaria sp. Ai002NY15]|nr:hypothetical protein J4E89_008157 [Alternaria sp. Ai002NY15]